MIKNHASNKVQATNSLGEGWGKRKTEGTCGASGWVADNGDVWERRRQGQASWIICLFGGEQGMNRITFPLNRDVEGRVGSPKM